MPTYDYVCEACDHRFEAFQKFSDDPLTDCPSCHQPRLRRLFGTGAAILFKGSGFYETDYRSEAYKSAAKADGEAAKPADSDKNSSSSDAGSSDSGKTTPSDTSSKPTSSETS